MQKVKLSLPATLTDLGPGLGGVGLAVGLRMIVEVSERQDNKFMLTAKGEGADNASPPLKHPMSLALMRTFQQMERAPLGLNVRIENEIPLGVGLGAEDAFVAAAVLSANNLLGNPYNREEMLKHTAQLATSAPGAITSIMGGLTIAVLNDDNLIYRALPSESIDVLVVLPTVKRYRGNLLTKTTATDDALYNLSRAPLFVHALQHGDLGSLRHLAEDRIRANAIERQIAGYTDVVSTAYDAGASAVSLSGDGPAMVILAETDYNEIEAAVVKTFSEHDTDVRTWTLPVDRQGVVISVAQSAR